MSGGGMRFESEGGLGGFQPATWGFQTGTSPARVAESEEYLDDEERERVERVL
jgi:hypothetical protein